MDKYAEDELFHFYRFFARESYAQRLEKLADLMGINKRAQRWKKKDRARVAEALAKLDMRYTHFTGYVPPPEHPPDVSPSPQRRKVCKAGRPVVMRKGANIIEYPSVSMCAEALSVSAKAITNCIDRDTECRGWRIYDK